MKKTLLNLALIAFWPLVAGVAALAWSSSDPCRARSADALNDERPELRALWERNQLRARTLELRAHAEELADAFAIHEGRMSLEDSSARAGQRFDAELAALQSDRAQYVAACRVLYR